MGLLFVFNTFKWIWHNGSIVYTSVNLLLLIGGLSHDMERDTKDNTIEMGRL